MVCVSELILLFIRRMSSVEMIVVVVVGVMGGKNLKVFFDISIGGDMEGWIVIEFFVDVVLRIVENFCVLCMGEKGIGLVFGWLLYFKVW